MEIRAQMLDTVVLGLPVRAGIRMVKLGVEVVHQSVAQFWITCGVVGIAHDKAQKANVRLSAKTMSDVHAMAPREYQTCDPITDIAICVAVIGGNNFMVPLPRETATVGDVRQAMARRGNTAATESYFLYAGRYLSDKFLLIFLLIPQAVRRAGDARALHAVQQVHGTGAAGAGTFVVGRRLQPLRNPHGEKAAFPLPAACRPASRVLRCEACPVCALPISNQQSAISNQPRVLISALVCDV